MPTHWAADPPARIRRLPTHLTLPVASRRDDVVIAGVRDGDLEPVGFSPRTGERRILVLGPAGSGRTHALMTLARGFLADGHPLALVGGNLDPWATNAAGISIKTATDATDGRVLTLGGTRPEDVERLITARRRYPDLAVVVDDVERLAGLSIEPVLLEIARRADEDRGLVVAATSTLAMEGRVGALAVDVARAHTGIVLWPPSGSSALGVPTTTLATPAAYTASNRIPGRGLLVTPRGVERIQVATLSPP
jgi:S-DNA-T family DNA segregation ATPase FtsK/SpoIIIE